MNNGLISATSKEPLRSSSLQPERDEQLEATPLLSSCDPGGLCRGTCPLQSMDKIGAAQREGRRQCGMAESWKGSPLQKYENDNYFILLLSISPQQHIP